MALEATQYINSENSFMKFYFSQRNILICLLILRLNFLPQSPLLVAYFFLFYVGLCLWASKLNLLLWKWELWGLTCSHDKQNNIWKYLNRAIIVACPKCIYMSPSHRGNLWKSMNLSLILLCFIMYDTISWHIFVGKLGKYLPNIYMGGELICPAEYCIQSLKTALANSTHSINSTLMNQWKIYS